MAFTSTIDVPEPFRAALDAGNPAAVCDAPAGSAVERLGRALARIAVGGRDLEARADLEAAAPELGDVCLIELAYLDVRARGGVEPVLETAYGVASRAAPNSKLAARAWHIIGLAEGKRRSHALAVDALLKAREIYNALHDRVGLSWVSDTLGMVEAARGRIDIAAQYYALSLADKALVGDRQGMALTLGNLGRLHLRSGRFLDAIECFERDLAIARDLCDERGQARMHEYLGRACLGLEQFDRANEEFDRCLELAELRGMRDLQFFALKDRALLQIAQKRFDDAWVSLAAAEQLLASFGEPFFGLTLAGVRGELLFAQRDPRSVEVLEEAIRGFEEALVPDLEIPARITLAQEFVRQGLPALAEQCLLHGLQLARSDGYARYLPRLNEAMLELNLVEGALVEQGREIGTRPAPDTAGYEIRQRLGKGAFGEVYRVFDPQRGLDLALKRLRLGTVYDSKRRQKLLASARLELEAASRIRHPGVARVYAIGTEATGDPYVVLEFIPGESLRARIRRNPTESPAVVAAFVVQVAQALAALHKARVVHRDLKPENIIIRPNGLPVLVDFGLAHLIDKEGTSSDQIAGTLAYMPPEQVSCKNVDGRADLYALGVIAYEWLMGARPFNWANDTTIVAICDEITSHTPTPIIARRTDLSPQFAALVMSLLEKNPQRRPESALRVVECLEAIPEFVPDSARR